VSGKISVECWRLTEVFGVEAMSVVAKGKSWTYYSWLIRIVCLGMGQMVEV
jgi:hypothetical protein